MKKRLFVSAVLIGILLILTSCLSSDFLPLPTGPAALVGTDTFALEDERRLVVQVWYPASDDGAGVLEPVMSKQEIKGLTGINIPLGEEARANRLPSNAFLDVPIEPSGAPYPVIIFDHGFEGYAKQNLTQMEELASHDYIVVSVSHPGESAVTIYPDGSVVNIDSERYPSLIAETNRGRRANARSSASYFEAMRNALTADEKIATMQAFAAREHISPLSLPISERKEDIINVMESLVAANSEGPFEGMMDLDRVGMYGHSMGGNTTNEVASLGDWPVGLRAAANLDGPQLLFPGWGVNVPQIPLLMAYSTGSYAGGVVVDITGANDWIFEQSEHENWRAVFYGSTHTNFTDLTYIKALEGRSTGKIDGAAFGLALEKLLLTWFDYHLKGIEPDLSELRDGYDRLELKVMAPGTSLYIPGG